MSKKPQFKNTIAEKFEEALRNKTRFPSSRGPLSLEQLWEAPLESKDNFNLDAIAKAVNAELKAVSEESFVKKGRNQAAAKLETALDIVKYVIETKVDEDEQAKSRAANKAEMNKLLDVLAKKEDAKLVNLSEKQIRERIAELSA